VAGIFAVVIAAGVVGGFALRDTAPDTLADSINPAFPLIGHYETVNNRQTVVCDPSSARAWSNGMGGVSLQVRMQGPGTIDVWIGGGPLNGSLPIHMTQQVTKRGDGANFVALNGDPGAWIQILADNKHDSGSCSVLPSGS
jgi:hypothetical protein